MQRMKGQGGPVSNGPKDPVNDEDFDSWRNQHPQSYNTSMGSMGDPYMSGYYGMSFPQYHNLGLGEGAWSNGGETMFLGGYGQQMGNDQHSHYMNDMLSGGGTFGGGFSQPGFNYFPGNGDYSAWGPSARKPVSHGHPYDDYYQDMYTPEQTTDRTPVVTSAPLKPIETGIQNLNINDKVGNVKIDNKSSIDVSKSVGVGGNASMGGPGGPGVISGVPVSGPESLPLNTSGGGVAPKKMTWASIASQPAKPQPKTKPKSIPPAPMLPGKHNLDIGTWESKNGNATKSNAPPSSTSRATWGTLRGRGGPSGGGGGGGGNNNNSGSGVGSGGGGSSGSGGVVSSNSNITPGVFPAPASASANSGGLGSQPGGGTGGAGGGLTPANGANAAAAAPFPAHPVLDKLRRSNDYNPKDFDLNPKNTRFFIIKSYSEDDIHRSIKYGIWCSTEHGNKRLDTAYRDQESRGPLYLFYSVNGSGHFCGMAQMVSEVDHAATSTVWAQDKWKGVFKVKWIYVKDVPNSNLRHIRLENNENKPVTNSRDTQEVPPEKGKQVLKIIHMYRHSTSIFDDFVHYEKRQEEEDQRRQVI